MSGDEGIISNQVRKIQRSLAAPFQQPKSNPLGVIESDKPKPVVDNFTDFRTFSFQPLQPFHELTQQQYVGPTTESNWVIPNILLVGAYPATQDDDETFEIISSILKLGVKKFVCLQQEYRHGVPEEMWRSGLALRPYFEDVVHIVKNQRNHTTFTNFDIVDEHKLGFDHVPIVDCGITDDSRVLDLSKKLVDEISKGQVIYLHCWGGHGRTGTVVSIMLHLMYGLNPVEAMARCQAVHDLRKCPVDVGSPQTQAQRDQVTRIINKLMQQYQLRDNPLLQNHILQVNAVHRANPVSSKASIKKTAKSTSHISDLSSNQPVKKSPAKQPTLDQNSPLGNTLSINGKNNSTQNSRFPTFHINKELSKPVTLALQVTERQPVNSSGSNHLRASFHEKKLSPSNHISSNSGSIKSRSSFTRKSIILVQDTHASVSTDTSNPISTSNIIESEAINEQPVEMEVVEPLVVDAQVTTKPNNAAESVRQDPDEAQVTYFQDSEQQEFLTQEHERPMSICIDSEEVEQRDTIFGPNIHSFSEKDAFTLSVDSDGVRLPIAVSSSSLKHSSHSISNESTIRQALLVARQTVNVSTTAQPSVDQPVETSLKQSGGQQQVHKEGTKTKLTPSRPTTNITSISRLGVAHFNSRKVDSNKDLTNIFP